MRVRGGARERAQRERAARGRCAPAMRGYDAGEYGARERAARGQGARAVRSHGARRPEGSDTLATHREACSHLGGCLTTHGVCGAIIPMGKAS